MCVTSTRWALCWPATGPTVRRVYTDEDVGPTGLVNCSADGAIVRLEIHNKAEYNDVVSLEARSLPDASLMMQKVVEAEARKSLRKNVAHNKQILARGSVRGCGY